MGERFADLRERFEELINKVRQRFMTASMYNDYWSAIIANLRELVKTTEPDLTDMRRIWNRYRLVEAESIECYTEAEADRYFEDFAPLLALRAKGGERRQFESEKEQALEFKIKRELT